jgi:hypothetical protein
LARAGGSILDDDEILACAHAEGELVASRRFAGVACVAAVPSPSAPCPARTVRDGDTCASVVSRGVLDLPRWAKAAAGSICEALARAPSIVLLSGEQTFDVELSIRAPDNDPTEAAITATARPDRWLPEAELESAAARAANALRYIGGTLSASDVVTRTRCRRAAGRPQRRGAAEEPE